MVHERYIVILPEGMPLARAAPIVCAGITMWDPLRHWYENVSLLRKVILIDNGEMSYINNFRGATKTDKKLNIGIVGIGGLGTMGIKLVSGNLEMQRSIIMQSIEQHSQ